MAPMSRQAPVTLDKESRLAFWMLAPTFTVVLAFVIFPVIWNLWLSVKPVTLGDLRGGLPFGGQLDSGQLSEGLL